jgi:UPF0716 protein FxsA
VLAVLVLVFVVAPLVELYVIVQVAHSVGAPETILLLAGVSIVGAWLAKQQGLTVLRRMQGTIAQGRVPSREIVDGALVLLAAALMIAPGFVSDVLAVLLLLPPVRAVVRSAILRRIRAGGAVVTSTFGLRGQRGASGPVTMDVDSWEDPPGSDGRHQIGP